MSPFTRELCLDISPRLQEQLQLALCKLLRFESGTDTQLNWQTDGGALTVCDCWRANWRCKSIMPSHFYIFLMATNIFHKCHQPETDPCHELQGLLLINVRLVKELFWHYFIRCNKTHQLQVWFLTTISSANINEHAEWKDTVPFPELIHPDGRFLSDFVFPIWFSRSHIHPSTRSV